MSDPYQQYPPQYNSPTPGQGYGAPPPNPAYDPNQPPQGYPQNQGYGSPAPYQQQGHDQPAAQYGQGSYDQQVAPYGGTYGPPAQGGFQHGQQFGTGYDANQAPVQQQDYYGQPGQDATRTYGTPSDPSHQFPQQGAYNQDPYPADPNNPHAQQQQGYYDPNNPNAVPGEGERGLGSSLAGGAAGYFLGKKAGNHGVLGALGGAVIGNYLGDKHKHNKRW